MSLAKLIPLFLLLAVPLHAAEPDWRFNALDGKTVEPFADPDTKAFVAIFITTDCPIANYYQPTIRELAKEYSGKSVAFAVVHSDTEMTEAKAKKHAEDFGITVPVILDTQQELAKRLGAAVTPEAFVISPEGAVLYQGRIDDTYFTWGRKRPEIAHHDLKDALDAVLSGQPIPQTKTKAIGCNIYFPKDNS